MNAVSRDEVMRYVNAQQMERLSGWASRKPVIALMGEFSSGKSTLLNMLVGQSILPMQVTATRLPPVWFRYGDKPSFWVDHEGQRHDVDLDDLGSVPINDARFIRIYALSEQLKKCDLIDTPGISDPNIPTDSWIRTIGYANSVLWCTHAGQAWRESERSQWESLPERLRENSLLLVTRADKIVSQEDLNKIHRRLKRETSDLFGSHHFISLTLALKARQAEDENDLWVRSGGEVLMKSLTGVLKAINAKRAMQLLRYQVEEQGSEPLDKPQDSAEVSAEARDNVSVLRPTRIRSESNAPRKSRLNPQDAANMRLDALNKADAQEEDGKSQQVSGSVAASETEKPQPRYVLMKSSDMAEPQPDEAVSEEQGFDEDISVETNENPGEQQPIVSNDEPEGDDEFFAEDLTIGSGPLGEETVLDPETGLQSEDKEIEAEDIKGIVATIAGASDAESDKSETDSAEEESQGHEFNAPKSPSEIWLEILAAQEIDTMPQMIEAITMLLEQLDRKHFDFQAA